MDFGQAVKKPDIKTVIVDLALAPWHRLDLLNSPNKAKNGSQGISTEEILIPVSGVGRRKCSMHAQIYQSDLLSRSQS